MAEQRIEIIQEFNRPVKAVYAYLSDHNNLAEIFGIPCRRVRDGEGDLNGPGSVRRIGVGPLAIEETVLTAVPGEFIEYCISKGGPLRNHHGQLRFYDSGAGSKVHWTITFESRIPLLGPVIRVALDQGLRRGLKKVC